MQLGTGLFTAQQRPDDDRGTADRYDEIIELTREIEAAGLDSAWVSEHHFAEDEYLSGTMPTLGAMAAATDDLEIGSCVALGPLYDPIRLAEDAATVDALADGRLTLGLAIGSNPREFDVFGVPRDERAERLADLVPFLRGAWSEDELGYDAEFHDVPTDVRITPGPVDGDVPIMLGGAAKPAVRRAARIGDAWCAPSSLSVEGVRKRVEDIRRVRDEEGIDGEFTIYVLQHGWVGDSREEAWEAMRDGYFYLQRRYAEIFSGESVDELEAERKRELKEGAIFGTPEGVREELETYREALGDDVHFILRTYYPGVDTEATVDCVHRLGDEVAPEL
ncbi:Flavin-dependent oxidoreductase, luciferase family (includes alkanesulfonate monooxygenase SsuD and methylene tetrahydromethanopterin reductase) [Halobiforma haloterrestris]|uniref:Flavin-dependent oxidoreductase, luciferase family (Includes alkanesulfonate monooxygenase SsuD and methylene tetrahydromethanopterin reductase) n=1 Tax=Natronobacterium haloterrestre TaxID=148448 RepID=A0A1I1D4S0_NATHA|nr:LLM class flavin-dependent oxidoreductase [Halobiforma haloterrestris]SFB67603.1 Flavin-dependent oxidoreductase, luciferase family (includes alkanesulfonate monooxygenase SsuD and methylene tetrahydromethanopterin reductase) [Halobiforma haloterrestris]